MLAALAGVTLVRVDFDRFVGEELDSVGIPSDSVPWFVLLDTSLHATEGISSDEWGDDVPANMAPVISAFVHHKYKARKFSPSRPRAE